MALQGDHLDREYISLAASSASEEEQAKSALKDGNTPVKVEWHIWRAQVKSVYIEPDLQLEPSKSLDF